MKIPKTMQQIIINASFYNSLARQCMGAIEDFVQELNVPNSDYDAIVDSYVQCVELTNDPYSFIEILEQYYGEEPK